MYEVIVLLVRETITTRHHDHDTTTLTPKSVFRVHIGNVQTLVTHERSYPFEYLKPLAYFFYAPEIEDRGGGGVHIVFNLSGIPSLEFDLIFLNINLANNIGTVGARALIFNMSIL